MVKRSGMALIVCVLAVACSAPASTPSPTVEGSEPAAGSTQPSVSPETTAVSSEPSPSSAAPPADPAWAALDVTGPLAREDHTWTVDAAGEVAYLFGGRDGATAFDDLWAYDLVTDEWAEVVVGGTPPARFGHEGVWVDGVGLVIFAGQADARTFFNDLWAYDPVNASWSQLPSGGAVPVSRYGTCAAIGPDSRLWISHGFTSDGTRFADTVAYDFTTGAWTDETPAGPLPVNRCLHGCWWTDGGALALFGGQTTGVTALGDLWLLSEDAWTRVEGTLPSDRNLYARARLESGATLLFGGQALDKTYLADTYLLTDGAADAIAIEPQGEPPPGRAGAEMVLDAARDRILLFGGRDADRAYDDLWELSDIGSSLGP